MNARGLLEESVGCLPVGDVDGWVGPQLVDGVEAAGVLVARAQAMRYVMIARADALGQAQVLGFRSTADWLAKTHGVANAGAMVHTARALRDDLHHTARALAQGVITDEHVRVIRYGHRVLESAFLPAEATVVEMARGCTPRQLRTFVGVLIQQYRPEQSDTDTDRARWGRKLFVSKTLDGWCRLDGYLPPEAGEAVSAALDVLAQRAGADDDRSPAMRRADALTEMAQRVAASLDRVSGHGQVTLHLTYEQLRSGLGVTWPGGGLLSRPEVSEHTCEAEVNLVVRDPVSWQPLQVGFWHRFATKAQRIALQARDGDTCAHTDCTVPANRCVAHHIIAWDQGGPTDLENLLLICKHHHREIHHGRFALTHKDGRYHLE